MQELLADLWPFFVAFYALDSLSAVRPFHWVFDRAGLRFGLKTAGLHLLGLWPGSEVAVAHDLPLLLVPGALVVFPSDRKLEPVVLGPGDLWKLPWEKAAPEAEGKKVLFGRVRALWMPTTGMARRTAQLLASLAEKPEAERQDELQRLLEASLDVEAARQTLARTRWLRLPLRELSFLFAMGVLIPLPMALFPSLRLEIPLMPVLAGLGGLWVAIAVLSVAVLWRGRAPKADWAGHLAPMLLFPPLAAHGSVYAFRGLLERFAGPALAAALLDRERFEVLARRELVRIEESAAKYGTDEMRAAFAGRRRIWERVLAQLDLTAEDVLSSRPAPSLGAALLCPTCNAQYRAGSSACSDCKVSLWPIEAPVRPERIKPPAAQPAQEPKKARKGRRKGR